MIPSLQEIRKALDARHESFVDELAFSEYHKLEVATHKFLALLRRERRILEEPEHG